MSLTERTSLRGDEMKPSYSYSYPRRIFLRCQHGPGTTTTTAACCDDSPVSLTPSTATTAARFFSLLPPPPLSPPSPSPSVDRDTDHGDRWIQQRKKVRTEKNNKSSLQNTEEGTIVNVRSETDDPNAIEEEEEVGNVSTTSGGGKPDLVPRQFARWPRPPPGVMPCHTGAAYDRTAMQDGSDNSNDISVQSTFSDRNSSTKTEP